MFIKISILVGAKLKANSPPLHFPGKINNGERKLLRENEPNLWTKKSKKIPRSTGEGMSTLGHEVNRNLQLNGALERL
jgi:hypothetical protein